jgi:hypothetical protein
MCGGIAIAEHAIDLTLDNFEPADRVAHLTPTSRERMKAKDRRRSRRRR